MAVTKLRKSIESMSSAARKSALRIERLKIGFGGDVAELFQNDRCGYRSGS